MAIHTGGNYDRAYARCGVCQLRGVFSRPARRDGTGDLIVVQCRYCGTGKLLDRGEFTTLALEAELLAWK